MMEAAVIDCSAEELLPYRVPRCEAWRSPSGYQRVPGVNPFLVPNVGGEPWRR